MKQIRHLVKALFCLSVGLSTNGFPYRDYEICAGIIKHACCVCNVVECHLHLSKQYISLISRDSIELQHMSRAIVANVYCVTEPGRDEK